MKPYEVAMPRSSNLLRKWYHKMLSNVSDNHFNKYSLKHMIYGKSLLQNHENVRFVI